MDGPSASGKSTISRELAVRLGLPYVNTGLMYRAVAARALALGVAAGDEVGLARIARDLRFDLAADATPREIRIDGRPAGAGLATPEVEAVVSRMASHPEVRAVLRAEQRRLGLAGAVMEGRDIGSVVFPEADVKVFLWAHPETRVARRERERADPTLGPAVERRDALDARTNPPQPAPGAVTIDTTSLTREEVFEAVYRIVRETLGRASAPLPPTV